LIKLTEGAKVVDVYLMNKFFIACFNVCLKVHFMIFAQRQELQSQQFSVFFIEAFMP